MVGAQARAGGAPVMTGPGDRPLLMLAREQKGRVALFLSDHAWLWARGFRDGGPYLDLLRRLSHWLMKEPELEEEALRATVRGATVEVERQTLRDNPGPITITGPDGQSRTVTLEAGRPGLFTARIPTSDLGPLPIDRRQSHRLRQRRPREPARTDGSGQRSRRTPAIGAGDRRLLAADRPRERLGRQPTAHRARAFRQPVRRQ
jgi:hypothetical protein